MALPDKNRSEQSSETGSATHSYRPAALHMHTHTHSNIRCVRLSRVVAGGGDAYVDVITYEHTQPDTWDREALLPGIFCDREEQKKRSKHFSSVEASDSRNEFVPFAVNEYGGIGPQAEAFIDSILTISPDRVVLKTYVMRRIAAVTAEPTGVHGGVSGIPSNLHKYAKLHARLGGHVPACWGLGGMRYRVQLCELRKRGLKGHFQSRPKLPI